MVSHDEASLSTLNDVSNTIHYYGIFVDIIPQFEYESEDNNESERNPTSLRVRGQVIAVSLFMVVEAVSIFPYTYNIATLYN